MKRAVALTLSLIVGAGLALMSPMAASAGETPPPYVVYAMGTYKSGVQLVAKIPGTKTRIALSERRGLHLAPSASLDGDVVAYVTLTGPNDSMQGWTTVIRKEGRVVERRPYLAAGGLLPSVSSDGRFVVMAGVKGLLAYSTARDRWSPLCPLCPKMTSVTSASLSPDGAKLAIIRKIVGTEYVEIRRISDGHRMVIAPVDSQFSLTLAWNPTSDTIAFSAVEDQDGSTYSVIRTLTIRGVEAKTSFRQPASEGATTLFTSPQWINGAVWALKTTLTPLPDNLRTVAVTAADWQSPYVEFGTPLYDGPEIWRAELLILAAWTTRAPAPAKGR